MFHIKYLIISYRIESELFPIQFLLPTLNEQTLSLYEKWPFSSKNRPGQNSPGFSKFFGSCITADNAPRKFQWPEKKIKKNFYQKNKFPWGKSSLHFLCLLKTGEVGSLRLETSGDSPIIPPGNNDTLRIDKRKFLNELTTEVHLDHLGFHRYDKSQAVGISNLLGFLQTPFIILISLKNRIIVFVILCENS